MEQKILYHYTSMATLKAIIENIEDDLVTFRATHIDFLNDTTEYKIGFEIVKELFQQYENEGKDTERKKLSEKMTDNHYRLLGTLFYKSDPFIASFSAESDCLPMWTTYADKGGGVAIGIIRIKPEDIVSPDSTTTPLSSKCSYNSKKLKDELKDHVYRLYPSLKFENKTFTRPLLFRFGEKMATIKHSSFKYEREYRLVNNIEHNSPHIKYNEVNGLLKPYIEYKLNKSALKEIVIGPCADKELSKTSLGLFLKKYKLQDIKLKPSDCPYRII